ncbi:hypothetical protein [Zavarzinella formosa]|uniref:hypothetical protein n=1 Tax=Zavarzinella formosa TaxID=360055 RepID=UPI000309F090|nr:hypothetical protein [Zavarzinella formosa]
MPAGKKYREDHKETMDDLLLNRPGVRLGQMFGHPAYFLRDHMFACVVEEGVCFKVPDDYAESRVGEPGVEFFKPGGQPMRGWIQIDREESDEYREEHHLIQTSMTFVGSLPPKKPKGKK